MALEFEPGDEVVFYVTGVQAFGGIATVRSDMFEDRTPIWPQGKKKYPEPYPWRVEAEPAVILAEEDFVPAASLAAELEHVRKWPAEHWHLAFQGQLRTVGEADAALLPRVEPLLRSLREARDRLTDAEAHEALAGAAPGNGGGTQGRNVGEAFLEVRRGLAELEKLGVVIKDLDRGLIDFPAIRDGREVYLCWQLDEDEIGFWHDIDAGFGGREPLE